MKFYYQFFLIALFSPILLQALSTKLSDEPVLSSTPKAHNLRDHFGVNKYRNIYGPPPTINLDNFLIKNADDSWTKIPNPALANEVITPDGKKCDITRHAYYDICYAAPSCAECSIVESCGIYIICYWCFYKRNYL